MISPPDSATEPRDRPVLEQRPVVTKVEARQGVTGHNVRYVLGFGLAAIIIAFAVIYVIYFA
jgi:hypothetical protein